MYLLDTDTISNCLKKNPSPALLRRLAEIPGDQQYTSAITVGELVYGAYRSDRPEYFLRQLEERVWPNVQVLPFDEASARTYGKVRADLEKKGRPVSEPDLRIGAIALTHDLTVVTANSRHFSLVPGLRIENWLQPPTT